MREVERLRALGYKRITLKTGAYSLKEMAMAIKYCSRAKIDLLTIDGASGGTGMRPWRMMEEWGIPSIYLHSAAWEYASILADRGERVPDLAFAGGFSSEDGVFKALALGAPYVKAVCMGRALTIPGMVGKTSPNGSGTGTCPKPYPTSAKLRRKFSSTTKRSKTWWGRRKSKPSLWEPSAFTATRTSSKWDSSSLWPDPALQHWGNRPEGPDVPH
jgi:glutamate synthase domain-containing protein 2